MLIYQQNKLSKKLIQKLIMSNILTLLITNHKLYRMYSLFDITSSVDNFLKNNDMTLICYQSDQTHEDFHIDYRQNKVLLSSDIMCYSFIAVNNKDESTSVVYIAGIDNNFFDQVLFKDENGNYLLIPHIIWIIIFSKAHPEKIYGGFEKKIGMKITFEEFNLFINTSYNIFTSRKKYTNINRVILFVSYDIMHSYLNSSSDQQIYILNSGYKNESYDHNSINCQIEKILINPNIENSIKVSKINQIILNSSSQFLKTDILIAGFLLSKFFSPSKEITINDLCKNIEEELFAPILLFMKILLLQTNNTLKILPSFIRIIDSFIKENN